jgi:hypothetical protein
MGNRDFISWEIFRGRMADLSFVLTKRARLARIPGGCWCYMHAYVVTVAYVRDRLRLHTRNSIHAHTTRQTLTVYGSYVLFQVMHEPCCRSLVGSLLLCRCLDCSAWLCVVCVCVLWCCCGCSCLWTVWICSFHTSCMLDAVLACSRVYVVVVVRVHAC